MIFDKKISRSEMVKCVLCADPKCSTACPVSLPGDVLRSIWFENEKYAAAKLSKMNPCINCNVPCEPACIRPRQVPIRALMNKLYSQIKPNLEVGLPEDESALKCTFAGIELENPFLLASSAVCRTYEMTARAFEAGWAGAVFKTINYMDIHEASPRYAALKGDNNNIIGFKNIEQLSTLTVEECMETLKKLKENYPTKAVISSIMGRNEEEWISLAKLSEEAKADAIELNFSCPNMAEDGTGSDIEDHPELVEKYTKAAKTAVSIPVIVKLSPNNGSIISSVLAAKRAGADGIASTNTLKSVLGINPYTFIASPAVHGRSAVGGLSGAAIKPISLRVLAQMAKNPELKEMEFSGIGGIESWMDALEYILLGAECVQVSTAVMKYGYRIIDELKSGLNYYLSENRFHSIENVRDHGLESLYESTNALERDTVLFPNFQHDKCISCGRCMISCQDGGHQAISMNKHNRPVLDGEKCVGCHLCLLVCPQQAITASHKRIEKMNL